MDKIKQEQIEACLYLINKEIERAKGNAKKGSK